MDPTCGLFQSHVIDMPPGAHVHGLIGPHSHHRSVVLDSGETTTLTTPTSTRVSNSPRLNSGIMVLVEVAFTGATECGPPCPTIGTPVAVLISCRTGLIVLGPFLGRQHHTAFQVGKSCKENTLPNRNLQSPKEALFLL